MTQLAKKILFTIIRGYQKLISPFLPARCRYYPTCSHYGLQAISWHGARLGGWLTVKRICRCHPLGGHGVDFVPLPLYRFQFHYVVKDSVVELDSIRSNFVYIDNSDYSYQLNQWLKKPIVDKY